MTSKLYIRCVSAIEAEWLGELAPRYYRVTEADGAAERGGNGTPRLLAPRPAPQPAPPPQLQATQQRHQQRQQQRRF